MTRQERNVVNPLPQWRDRDGKDAQAEVEILAEAVGFRLLAQIAIRRCNNADIGGPLRLDLGRELAVSPPRRHSSAEAIKVADAALVTEAERKREERENILAALERAGGKLYGPGGAAELLGVKPTTLASRMKKMSLKRPDRAGK